MRKKIIIGLAVILFSAIVSANANFAAAYFPNPEAGPYMTLFEETDWHSTPFGWDETPYLYLRFDDSYMNYDYLTINSSWYQTSSGPFYWTSEFHADEDWDYIDIWQSGRYDSDDFSPGDWSDIREAGTWNVSVDWSFVNDYFSDGGSGETSFTVNAAVVPEPLSCLLFVVGGAALTAGYQRKKKKQRRCPS